MFQNAIEDLISWHLQEHVRVIVRELGGLATWLLGRGFRFEAIVLAPRQNLRREKMAPGRSPQSDGSQCWWDRCTSRPTGAHASRAR
jgi:hypothetical protein